MITGAEFLGAFERHILLAATALAGALLLGVPLGVLSAFNRRLGAIVLGLANIGRVIPSLAMLTLMLPFFGVGLRSAVIALTLLALPPIAINTDIAFRTIPFAARDAARGLGMTFAQRLRRVEFPLAAPVLVTGIRTAATELIASATLAAFVGAGGLGELIWRGLQANQSNLLITGSLAVAALAIAVELLFILATRRIGARS